MIRPSSLQAAEHCELSAVLSAEFPHTNAGTVRGSLVDQQVSDELRGGPIAEDPDARACVQFIREHLYVGPGHWLAVQEKVALHDPDTGELLCKGTPDVVGMDLFETSVIVVDMKKREQWYAANLAPPDENLQLGAYGLAHSFIRGAPYQTCILLFGDGAVEPLWSRTYTNVESRPILDRIRAIAAREKARGATRPVGVVGSHCSSCYSKRHCPAWLLPAHDGPTALAPYVQPGGITRENSERAFLLYKQLDDARGLLRGMLEDHVAAEGPIPVGEGKQWGPIAWPARESVDLRALKADGLERYIRKGTPSVQWRITRQKP